MLFRSICVWQGLDIVQVERGWTMVISGSVAFTGGVVTMALGILACEIRALRASFAQPGEARAASAPEPTPLAPQPPPAPQPAALSDEQQAFAQSAVPVRARGTTEQPEAPKSFGWPLRPTQPPANGSDVSLASTGPRPPALRRFEANGIS